MVVDMTLEILLTTGSTGKWGSQGWATCASCFASLPKPIRPTRKIKSFGGLDIASQWVIRLNRTIPGFCPVSLVVKMFLPGFALFLSLAFVFQSLVSAAESLPDPTRPPAGVGAAVEVPGVAAAGPVLQSVLISSGRKSAIISGKTVALGGKYGDARLVRISENDVVLKTGSVTETVRLFPDVEKRPSGVAAPNKMRAGRARQKESR